MCGIYGVINRKVRREQAMECLDTMIHRGPDGFGLWQEDGVTLGHRRLAILDLTCFPGFATCAPIAAPEASRCPTPMSATG